MLHHKIHSIAASCENRGIGLAGRVPWKLESEFAYYERMVTGNPPPGKKNVVIYGRKTSGRPTMGCYNIVLSRTMKKEKQPWVDAVVKSLDELVSLLSTEEWLSKTHTIYSIGGAEIYKLIQDTPFCGRVYLTRIKAVFEADTFFPDLDEKHFRLLDRIPEDVADVVPYGMQVENGVQWFVEIYERIPTT